MHALHLTAAHRFARLRALASLFGTSQRSAAMRCFFLTAASRSGEIAYEILRRQRFTAYCVSCALFEFIVYCLQLLTAVAANR